MPNFQLIQNVTDFASLVRYLEEELEWPFQGVEDVEDALYEFEAGDVGLDEKHSAKIKSIKQIAPLAANQPWGIFWIDFGDQRPSITALRGVLRGLVKKKRESANESDRQRFALENLLFILTSEDFRKFDFGYFQGDGHSRSTLSLFGWEKNDPRIRTLCEHNLPKLAFPLDPRDHAMWLKGWQEAFDIEKLSKAFFKRYKELFGQFCDHLASSAEYRELFLNSRTVPKEGWKDPIAKPIRDFTKILLGRLVFLQFLEKKGWLGVPADKTAWENGDSRFLKNLFERTQDKEHFHSRVLRKLFFETLNNKERYDGLVDPMLGNDIRIPYLNGGLFDTDISTGNPIDFPPKLFQELFEFFDRYNFTIEEDDPYNRQVGIDPEMLGHIFENLLEENREKGAFYTPKEIVHYMCQESLIEYLATHLPEGDRPAIETLVRDNQVGENFTGMAKATKINDLLRDVKICDPAIGSGAFPMGLLKEIFECRRLIYPYLKTNETFDPARIKKEIIQNNIYGVDIDNGAVEIARLRFWLALVVDEIEPAPLPNLDYKIMQGNSLLEQFEDISLVFDKAQLSPDTYVERNLFGEAVSPQTSLMDVLRVQQELGNFDVTKLESEFFGTEDAQQKAHIREQLNRLERLVIEQAIKAKESSIRSEIAKINAEIKHKKSAVRAEQRDNIIPVATYKKLAKLEAQLEGVEKSKERLQAIRPDTKPYFLWHLYFQEVFDKDGFDIVIGNPPYLESRHANFREADKEAYQKAVRARWPEDAELITKGADLLIYFYELALTLIKRQTGRLVFLTQNSWLDTDYGKKFQLFLTRHTSVRSIVDSDFKYFDGTDGPNINTIISLFCGRVPRPQDKIVFARFHESFAASNISYDQLVDATVQPTVAHVRVYNHSDPLVQELKWGVLLTAQDDIFFQVFAALEANAKRLSEANLGLTFGQGLNLSKAALVSPEHFAGLGIREEHCLQILSSADGAPFAIRKTKYRIIDEYLIDPKKAVQVRKASVELFDSRRSRKTPPILIMPRGLGRHFCALAAPQTHSSSGVDIYDDSSSTDTETRLNLWLALNSSVCWLWREICGRKNLGGGMLKAEAVDLDPLPIYMDFNSPKEVRKIFESISVRQALDSQKEIHTSEHHRIDCIVSEYLGLTASKAETIRQLLSSKIAERTQKSRT